MDKCPHEEGIKALERRDSEIVEWMQRLEKKVDGLTEILVEVKMLESKNVSHKEAIDRAFAEIKDLKDREIAELKKKIETLEAAYNQGKGAAGMVKYTIPALWAILSAVLTYYITTLTH